MDIVEHDRGSGDRVEFSCIFAKSCVLKPDIFSVGKNHCCAIIICYTGSGYCQAFEPETGWPDGLEIYSLF